MHAFACQFPLSAASFLAFRSTEGGRFGWIWLRTVCAIRELFGRFESIPYTFVREGVAYLVDEAGRSEYAALGRGRGRAASEEVVHTERDASNCNRTRILPVCTD